MPRWHDCCHLSERQLIKNEKTKQNSSCQFTFKNFNDYSDKLGWASHNLLPIWKFHISRDDSNIAMRKGQELPQAPTRASCCAHPDAHSHIFTLLLQTVFSITRRPMLSLWNPSCNSFEKAWLHLYAPLEHGMISCCAIAQRDRYECAMNIIGNILGTFTSLLFSISEPKA